MKQGAGAETRESGTTTNDFIQSEGGFREKERLDGFLIRNFFSGLTGFGRVGWNNDFGHGRTEFGFCF